MANAGLNNAKAVKKLHTMSATRAKDLMTSKMQLNADFATQKYKLLIKSSLPHCKVFASSQNVSKEPNLAALKCFNAGILVGDSEMKKLVFLV